MMSWSVELVNELIKNVEQWFIDKNLDKGDSFRQLSKTTEELGEVASALNKNNITELKDGIGDVTVTLIGIALQNNLTLEECLGYAYNEIKDRTGKTVNGVFVKESDLG